MVNPDMFLSRTEPRFPANNSCKYLPLIQRPVCRVLVFLGFILWVTNSVVLSAVPIQPSKEINMTLSNRAGFLMLKPDGLKYLDAIREYLLKAGFKIESQIELPELLPDEVVEELYPQYNNQQPQLEGLKKYLQSGKVAILFISSKQPNTQEKLRQLVVKENAMPGPLRVLCGIKKPVLDPSENYPTITKDKIHCPQDLKTAIRELQIILPAEYKTELFATETGQLKSLTVDLKATGIFLLKKKNAAEADRDKTTPDIRNVVNVLSRWLGNTPERIMDKLTRAGMTPQEQSGTEISLKRFKEIIESDGELKSTADKIYLKEAKKDLWLITGREIKDAKPLASLAATGDMLFIEDSSGVQRDFEQDASVSVVNTISHSTMRLEPLDINAIEENGHNDPLSLLEKIHELKKFLAYEHYFENNSIGTDECTNAAIVRHVDFASAGRGGLNFKLERIYSSLNAVAQKGAFLQNQQLKKCFKYMLDVLPAVESTTKDKLFHSFYPQARNVTFLDYPLLACCLVDEGADPPNDQQNQIDYNHAIDSINHAQSMEQLIAAVTGYNWQYAPSISYLPIDQDSDIVASTRIPLKIIDNSLALFVPIHTPYHYQIAITFLINRMAAIWDFCQQRIQEYRAQLRNVINTIEIAEKEQTHYFSYLGDGWSFGITFIEPPIVENGEVKRNGMIFFEGYRPAIFRNLDYQEFRREKAVFRVIDPALNIQIQGKPVDIKYRIDQNDQIFYFDRLGRLRHITDNTHNNSIDYYYQTDAVAADLNYRRLAKIVDAAANSYSFQYSATPAQNVLVIVARDSQGMIYKKCRYKIQLNQTGNYQMCNLVSVEEADWQTSATTEEAKYEQGNKTIYQYEDYMLFSGSVPNYNIQTMTVNISPIAMKLSLLKNEINPLGGMTSFNYQKPEFTTSQIALLPNRALWEKNVDANNVQFELINYKIYRNLGLVKSIQKETEMITAHPAYKEWYEYVNQSQGIDFLKWKQTMEIDQDKFVQNDYLYSSAREKYELHSKKIYPIQEWKIPKKWDGIQVAEWEKVSYQEFISGGYHISAGDYPGRIDFNPRLLIQDVESLITLLDLKARLDLDEPLLVYLACLILKLDIIPEAAVNNNANNTNLYVPDYAQAAVRQLQTTVNGLRRTYSDYFMNHYYDDIYHLAHDWAVIQGLDSYSADFKNKLREFQTQIKNAFEEFIVQIRRSNYNCVNALLGSNIITKNFEYDDFGNIKAITSENIDMAIIHDPQNNPPRNYIKQIYVYPPDNNQLNRALTRIYGLPIAVKWVDAFSGNLRTINNDYSLARTNYYPVQPQIKKISGDIATLEYGYNESDAEGHLKDPAGCNKPTSITQVNASATERFIDEFWYDAYGNMTRTKDAEQRKTLYQYDEVELRDENGQPILDQNGLQVYFHKRFLNKIIKKGIDYDIFQSLTHDKNGKLVNYTDGNQNQFFYSYDNFNRLGKVELQPKEKPKVVIKEYFYGDVAENQLPKNVTRIRERITTENNNYKQTDLASDKQGNLKTIRYAAGDSASGEEPVVIAVFYDRANRVRNVIQNRHAVTAYEYDYLDRSLSIKDPRGGIRATDYDDIYRFYDINGQRYSLRKEIWKNPVGTKEIHYYDFFNRLTFIETEVPIISNNIVRQKKIYYEYHWDKKNRLQWLNYPDHTSYYRRYDDFDRVRIQGWHRNLAAGEHIKRTLDYNSAHQIIKIIDENENIITYGYDEFGRLRSRTRPLNDVTIYSHDPNDNITTINYKNRITNYSYNAQNLLETLIYPEGEKITYGYDWLGRLITRQVGSKPPRKYSYDTFNRLVRYEDEENNVYQQSYNPYGGLNWSIEPRGKITKKIYTTNYAGDVITVTNTKDETIEYVRDKLGRPTRVLIHPLNMEYNIAYHPLGKTSSITMADLNQSTWKNYYDEIGRLVQKESPESRMTYIHRDFLGRIIRTYQGNHEEEKEYHYDKRSNLIQLLDAGELVTEYKYDGLDRLKEIIPYGNPTLENYAQETQHRAKVQYSYQDMENQGQKVTITSSGQSTQIIESDKSGRITRILEAAEPLLPEDPAESPLKQAYRITKYDYNQQGDIYRKWIYHGALEDKPSLNPLDTYSEEYDYYSHGLVKNIKYCQGDSIHLEYDPNGNIHKLIDESQLVTEFKYSDTVDLPTGLIHPDGLSHTYKYDCLGRPIYLDEGSPVHVVYDDFNRKINYQLKNGDEYTCFYNQDYFLEKLQKPNLIFSPLVYAYDTASRLATIKDSNGHVTKYIWNKQGSLEQISVKPADSSAFHPIQRKVSYYPDGKVSQIKELNGNAQYTYNLDGRLARIDYQGQEHSWAEMEYYNENGRLKRIKYSDELTKLFKYDRMGNILKVIENENKPNQKEIEFTRDARGRIIKESINGDQVAESDIAYENNGLIKTVNGITYLHDPITGQLKEISLSNAEGKNFILKFEYYPNGRIKKQYFEENGSVKYYQGFVYDENGRISSITNNSTFFEISYDKSGNPNLVKRASANGNSTEVHYTYDGEDRLRFIEERTDHEIEYRYDERGNLVYEHNAADNTTITRQYDSSNQLKNIYLNAGIPALTFTYDARGNLTNVSDAINSRQAQYEYEGWHRLKCIKQKKTNVSKYTVVKELQYDAINRLCQDNDAATGKIQTLKHALVYPVALRETSPTGSISTLVVPDINNFRPFGFIQKGELSYFTWILGNNEDIHNEQGRLINTQHRLPFGDGFTTEHSINPFGYKGYFGLLGPDNIAWAFTRMYHPRYKSFLSPDIMPGNIFNPISMNNRRVFSANPLRYIDLLGLQDEPGTEPNGGVAEGVPCDEVIIIEYGDFTEMKCICYFPEEEKYHHNLPQKIIPKVNIPDFQIIDLPHLSEINVPGFEGSSLTITEPPAAQPTEPGPQTFEGSAWSMTEPPAAQPTEPAPQPFEGSAWTMTKRRPVKEERDYELEMILDDPNAYEEWLNRSTMDRNGVIKTNRNWIKTIQGEYLRSGQVLQFLIPNITFTIQMLKHGDPYEAMSAANEIAFIDEMVFAYYVSTVLPGTETRYLLRTGRYPHVMASLPVAGFKPFYNPRLSYKNILVRDPFFDMEMGRPVKLKLIENEPFLDIESGRSIKLKLPENAK